MPCTDFPDTNLAHARPRRHSCAKICLFSSETDALGTGRARTLQAAVRPVPVPSASASELNRQVLLQEYRRGRAWAKLVSGKSVQGTKLVCWRQQRLQAKEEALSQARAVVRASEAEDLALATASLSLQDSSFP